MRRLITILLLFAIGYSIWYYTPRLFNAPVEAPLLVSERESMDHITIERGEETFEFLRGAEGHWVVRRGQRLLQDRSDQVTDFVNELYRMRTDSFVRKLPDLGVMEEVRVVMRGGRGQEGVTLSFPQPNDLPVYATYEGSGAVFALSPSIHHWLERYLSFESYRRNRLLDLSPSIVDSIHFYRGDSLWHWVIHGDLAGPASQYIAPASAPHADFFDEIGHRDRAYGEILLFTPQGQKRIAVYHDSLWAQPFVLVGEDYPRRFIAYDKLR